MTASNSKSACVLRLTALGDCVNCFGMLCAMRAADPDADLQWIIDRRFAPLFRDADGRDIIPMVPLDFSHGIARAMLQARSALRGRRFDFLLDMQTSLKASLISLAVRARDRLGYDSERSREGQFMFVSRKVPSPANPHVLAGFMAFAREAGFGDLQPRWDFRLSEKELAPYLALSSEKPLFTIAPASARAQKNWSPEGYAALADYAAEHGFKVVLAGSKAKMDSGLCEAIQKLAHCQCQNLCGKTSLRQLAALLACSSLALAPDSASMHIASAVNTPVIGLFAVHNPARVGSWKYPDLWVSAYRDLAKAELKGRHVPWRYRVRDEHAMSHITIDAVKEAFDTAMDHYAPQEGME
jgi:heptosyltransferase I